MFLGRLSSSMTFIERQRTSLQTTSQHTKTLNLTWESGQHVLQALHSSADSYSSSLEHKHTTPNRPYAAFDISTAHRVCTVGSTLQGDESTAIVMWHRQATSDDPAWDVISTLHLNREHLCHFYYYMPASRLMWPNKMEASGCALPNLSDHRIQPQLNLLGNVKLQIDFWLQSEYQLLLSATLHGEAPQAHIKWALWKSIPCLRTSIILQGTWALAAEVRDLRPSSALVEVDEKQCPVVAPISSSVQHLAPILQSRDAPLSICEFGYN